MNKQDSVNEEILSRVYGALKFILSKKQETKSKTNHSPRIYVLH